MQNRAARVVTGDYDWNLNGMDILSQLYVKEGTTLHVF